MMITSEPMIVAKLKCKPKTSTEPTVAVRGSKASNMLATVGEMYFNTVVKVINGITVPIMIIIKNIINTCGVNVNVIRVGETTSRPIPAITSPHPVISMDEKFFNNDLGINVFVATPTAEISP